MSNLTRSCAAAALAVTLATPAFGGQIATPYVAGSHQGWDENANPMTETFAGSDIWTATFSGLGANARHEFKITDGTWANNLPGPNSWFYADGLGNITITYDGNTYADGWSPSVDRLGLSTTGGSWNAVGNWQSQVGGGDWANNNPNTIMTPLGGGIYEFSAVLAPGNYLWKAVVDGTWDSISWDGRSVGTSDWGFSTDAVNNTAIFRVDAQTGVAQITVVPEPSTLGLAVLGGLAALGVTLRRRS